MWKCVYLLKMEKTWDIFVEESAAEIVHFLFLPPGYFALPLYHMWCVCVCV